jgi:signal transduction histidine kinase
MRGRAPGIRSQRGRIAGRRRLHRGCIPEGEGPLGKVSRLNSVVSSLAIYAPVVVIGAADQQSELAFLVEAGAADFVERAGGCLPIALEMVERRLRHAQQTGSDAQQFNGGKNVVNGEAFRELLRHEMNNPLTGILGNAELLLAGGAPQK